MHDALAAGPPAPPSSPSPSEEQAAGSGVVTSALADPPPAPVAVPPAATGGAVAAPVVDVVVPVFNEAHVLAASITRLQRFLTAGFPFSWRVTIADNASTDGTWTEAQALAATLDGVRAVRIDRKGRGLALRTVWQASDAAVVAYMDVDLSTDLDALLPLVAPLVSGHSDVAIGSRLAPGASVARRPKRELISRCYNLMLRALFATPVRDAQCGFKAVRTDVARRLLPVIEDDGWFFDTELLLLARRNGLRIHEVPVDWIDDPDSRVHIASTAMGDLRGSARVFRSFLRGDGLVDLGDASRPQLDDDFGRRIVSFGAIGLASTAVSLLLFVLLRVPLGAVVANAVALTATFAVNTWAHARFSARGARPRWGAAVGLYGVALLGSSAALAVTDALGGGLVAEVMVLAVTWTAAGLARLALVSAWSRAAGR